MAKETKLGYEMPTGAAVTIPLRHTAVTGQTQESGKTTTLEALITRSGLRAVAFITKRGEKSFRLKTNIPPYFREPVVTPETPMWRWVESILESATNENTGKEERAAIIQASDHVLEAKQVYRKKQEDYRTESHPTTKRVSTLEEVHQNIRIILKAERGSFRRACVCLDAYFEIVIPQIKRLRLARELVLEPGVNVMDLEGFTDEMQALVIRSVVETVYREMKNTVVIIPEAAKFIPNRRSSPVRFAAEMFIRQGLGIGNVLMIDSQDLANVATEVLKSIGVWILGKQTEINEVKRVVDYIPAMPKIAPIAIQQLGRGEFYAVFSDQVRKVYVQPAGMDDVHAQAIARGEERAESWTAIVRSLPATNDSKPVVDPPVVDPRIMFADRAIDAEAKMWEDTEKADLVARLSEELAALRQEWDARVDEVDRLREENTLLLAKLAERDAITVACCICGKQANHSIHSVWFCEPCYTNSPQEEIERIAKNGGRIAEAKKENDAMPVSVPAPRGGGSPHPESVHALANGEFSRFLAWLRQTPEAIALIAAQPRIEVTIDRPTLELDGSTTKGRLARLLAEKFFANARTIEEMIAEFRRRGWMAATGRPVPLNLVLKDLCELGFLTMEPTGYQAVPEMQVRIREAKP